MLFEVVSGRLKEISCQSYCFFGCFESLDDYFKGTRSHSVLRGKYFAVRDMRMLHCISCR